jgi:hypothetical protein
MESTKYLRRRNARESRPDPHPTSSMRPPAGICRKNVAYNSLMSTEAVLWQNSEALVS